MAILDLLRDDDRLSESEKAIAAYILDHGDEVLTMSIQDLAEKTHTSPSSVVRFCRKAGTSGYRDFRIKLAAELQMRAEEPGDINYDFPVARNDSVRQIAGKIRQLTCDAVTGTARLIDPVVMGKAAKLVLGARRIALLAEGDSYARLMGFGNQLVKLGLPVAYQGLPGEGNHFAVTLGPQDVAVVASYGGEGRALTTTVRSLKRTGAKAIVLTSAPESHIGREGDVIIRVMRSEDNAFRISPMTSQAAIQYGLNVLYGCIYQADFDRFTRIRLGEESMFLSDTRFSPED